METHHALHMLNRLLEMLYRSLPVYLQGCPPWVPRGRERACEAIGHLAIDHLHYAERVAEAIQALGGQPHPGRFPSDFAALNDVSLDCLLSRVLELARRDLRCLEQMVPELTPHVRLRDLADEILGNTRGHLEILEELRPVAGPLGGLPPGHPSVTN